MLAKQELSRQEVAKQDFEKNRRMINQAFIKRNTTDAVFRTLVDEAEKFLDAYRVEKRVIPALIKIQRELEASLASCKDADDKYSVLRIP